MGSLATSVIVMACGPINMPPNKIYMITINTFHAGKVILPEN